MKEFDEGTRSPSKGKTFGIGWNKYERTYIQHRKNVYSGHFTENNPEAIYNGNLFYYSVRESPGKDKKAFSIYGRLKMFTEKIADITRGNPGPHHDVKERHLHDMKGLNERNFSFG